MIKDFIKIWDQHKTEIEEQLKKEHPDDYEDLVKMLITMLNKHTEKYNGQPDPERIYTIDDGDYQGTLVYVIAETGYQPDDYWYVKVWYGSCSVCDTLQSIRDCCFTDKPSDEEVSQYMTLCLHILQGLKKMGEADESSD